MSMKVDWFNVVVYSIIALALIAFWASAAMLVLS
jgi:hypothetical protein